MPKIYFTILAIFTLMAGIYSTTAQATCTYFNEFIDNRDGTVTDPRNGLVWQKCALGQTWNGSSCTGQTTPMIWADAMQAAKDNRFLGKNNWRLPKLSEFRRVIGNDGECAYETRAVSFKLAYPINDNGKLGFYWASTTSRPELENDERFLTKDDTSASHVEFDTGGFGGDYTGSRHLVRLIRYGERTSSPGTVNPKSVSAAPPQDTSTHTSEKPCVFQPVMTDEEIERCKRM